jgi:hypothetical protein
MDDYQKKRPAPTLTRENHEEWFTLLELHFQAEGIWSTVMGASIDETPMVEKQDAKARYVLFICTGELDRERIRGQLSAKEQWNTLKKRYLEERPSYGRQYLSEFVNYRMPADGSVEESWVKL